jgi:S-DNA-T family DNA segregation ATPase FtsK/SpoIIIE
VPDQAEAKDGPDLAAGVKSKVKPEKKAAAPMRYGSSMDDSNYKLPPIDLLSKGKSKVRIQSEAELKKNAAKLERALRDFKVEAHVEKVTVGPTVTRYEVEPDIGVKIQSIRSLEPDLALKLEVKSVRVVPMPGQSVVGIEAYNANTSIVTLREMIDSEEFLENEGKICFALGKNISGKRVIVDLKEMPHLLIAGTTNSGKSVCINSILLSILYRAKPSEVKLILIDPKVVELKLYNDLPHLLVPVVTDPERAAMALSYAVTIMNDRYKKFAEQNVRNLENYNDKMRKEGQYEEVMPEIVIVIDELNDLMMVASAKVQESISRLAQMARAAGMHLIVATQQPLASVLTSIIKSNIPSRIAFAVSSNSHSRVILDSPGAEKLLGKGDMLFHPLGSRESIRIQGSLAEENEVLKVVNFVKKQMDPNYSVEVMTGVNAAVAGSLAGDEDEFFFDAVEMVAQSDAKQVSVSMLQRRFRIGYNRAARLVDMMEERGIVAASDGTNKPRRLIMNEAQLNSFLESAGQESWFDEEIIIDEIEDEDDDDDISVSLDALETLGSDDSDDLGDKGYADETDDW